MFFARRIVPINGEGQETMNAQLLSVAAAAGLLGLSKRSLYNYCHDGIFPCVRIGRRVLIRRSDLDFVFNGNSVGSPKSDHTGTS